MYERDVNKRKRENNKEVPVMPNLTNRGQQNPTNGHGNS